MIKARQPNFLFLIVDQMSHFVLPVAQPSYRKAAQKAVAPNIAKLAAGGRVFTDCYTASPLCAPARASLATGTHVRRHRVCTNGDEFSASLPTYMHGLQSIGYRTTVSGKTHSIGPDQLHGFDDRQTTDIYPSDFIWSRDWDLPVKHDPGTSVDKLESSGLCRTNMQINYDTETKNRAVEFLQGHALDAKEKPFFMMVSFTQPHEPFQTLPKYWELYDDANIQTPSRVGQGDGDAHPYNRMLQIYHGIDRNAPDEERTRVSIRAHLGMISHVDDYIGQVLETLETLKMSDDTIVIFTSDHGEMLGAHDMWFKRTFYEESAHVPLIISWPGQVAPGVSSAVVSHVDLAPTILDLAGLEPKRAGLDFDGDSLKRILLAGEDPDWRGTALIDYFGDGTNTPMFMLRDGDWKLVAFLDFEPILYNLAEDPEEGTNLANRPEHSGRVSKMLGQIFADFDAKDFVEEIKEAQKTRIFIQNGRNQSETSGGAWDYQPHRDATKQYVRTAVNAGSSC
ncbi:choline-sulfatase [Devosia rhodophyticola]|uniref:Choline-sulfatase n=1 Tax=Devosia rhodophyticola TaxID=3026423 RepID=A0ABY7YY15_9HYPH|nr:choline-sulfatase [Devosia rhodophyticola]WDR06136.1 choline-sulfatase [Devosia rhodophyticola]